MLKKIRGPAGSPRGLVLYLHHNQSTFPMKNSFNQLCVWPGTLLEQNQVEDFVNFFQEEMGVRVQFKTVIFTNPDLDERCRPIAATGGRSDVFFYVHDEDIAKFAIPRISLGIRWWEDVIFLDNNNSHLYPDDFIQENPPKW